MEHYLNTKIVYDGVQVTDIFQKYDILKKYRTDDSALFMDYIVRDGETPQMIAKHVYGSTEFWWLVLISAQIDDPFYTWPNSDKTIEEVAKKRCPDWETNEAVYMAIYEAEMEKNEYNRNILILRPEYLPVVLKDLVTIHRRGE